MSDSPTKSFSAVFVLFWDIVCLRRGPEDLPASRNLLVVTIVLQALLALSVAAVLPPIPGQELVADHSIALLLLDIAVLLLWGAALLRAVGRSERYLQTMTATFGCQLVLQPVLAPAAWAMEYYNKDPGWSLPTALLFTGLGVWGLVALARVLRSATGWSSFFCALLVISQGLVTYLIAFALFPDLGK